MSAHLYSILKRVRCQAKRVARPQQKINHKEHKESIISRRLRDNSNLIKLDGSTEFGNSHIVVYTLLTAFIYFIGIDMDSAILLSIFGLAVNIVVAMVVVASFLWRIPSKEDLKRVEDKADDAIQQNQAIRGDISRLEDRFQGVSNQLQGMSNQLKVVESKADDAIQQRQAIRGDITRLEDRMQALSDRFQALDHRFEVVESKADDAIQQRQAIRGDISRLEDRIQTLSKRFDMMEIKADDAIKQNLAIRGDIKVLSEKVERIEGFFETPQLKTS